MVRSEKGLAQVKQRIERFVQGQYPIVSGENRIHFISAQKALYATLNGIEDEYLETFQNFIQALEKFLRLERGFVEIKQFVIKLKGLTQASLYSLHQAEEVLDGKLKLSTLEKQKILEQIGEASGRDVKIQQLAEQLLKATIDKTVESWDEWVEKLDERMAEKAASWGSDHSPLWDKEKLIQDYTNQFTNSLSREIDEWWETQVLDEVVKNNLHILEQKISHELETIKGNFQVLDSQMSTQLNQQFSFLTSTKNGSDINSVVALDESADNVSFSPIGGLGASGLTVGALVLFTGLGFVPLLLAGGAAAVVGSFLFGGPSEDELHFKVKNQVHDLGFEKFNESTQEIFNQIIENIASIFDNRVEQADVAIKQIISSYENILQQQEKAYLETVEQREAEKAWINRQRQELAQVQKGIKKY